MTEVVRVDRDRPSIPEIERAAACLRRGGLVAFPTETVYGLGVHAFNRGAVRRLFEVKGRPANDPLIVHVFALDQVEALVSAMPDCTVMLADHFWPGPLTLVLPRGPQVPLEVTAGLDTVAVRIPAHPVARSLLSAAAIPVAAPSANLFSRPSPTRADHVLDDLGGRIDMVIDAGPTDVGVESTVLDLTVEPAVVLRPGAVALEALQKILPRVDVAAHLRADDDAPMASPGLLSKHYSPRTPLTLYAGDESSARRALAAAAAEAVATGARVGVLATAEDARTLSALPVVVATFGHGEDAEEAATKLYAGLRDLDAAGVEIILARDVPHQDGLWRALRDRLHRAAARVVEVRDV